MLLDFLQAMLNEISLRNFKCFRTRTSIPVRNFNLLTGINGRGKSTALQSLLLMRQSLEHSKTTDRLIFNGSCIDLGTFQDVKNSNVSQREAVEIKFHFDERLSVHYFFVEDENDEMSMRISRIHLQGTIDNKEIVLETKLEDGNHSVLIGEQIAPIYWENLILQSPEIKNQLITVANQRIDFTRIHYISADRIGPRDFYPKHSFSDFPNVGRQGEYSPNLLFRMRNNQVNDLVCQEKIVAHTLLDQTQAWLSAIFYGARIDPKPTDANLVLLTLRADETPTEGYKPINVGFGYSYALPIIVSGLIAQPGEIFIVENPEAHLHPYAQSQIIKFLTLVSKTGVQVFVETHSDHVLNAVRLSVLDQLLTPNDVNILFFGGQETGQITQIPVDSNGRIGEWPGGFFERLDKDFSRLLG